MNRHLWVAGLLALLFAMGWFLCFDPFPVAVDTAFHVRYLEDFHRALREGDGWPDWDSRPYSGRGTPAFRFYAPGVYLLGSLFMSCGASVFLALKLVICLCTALGIVGTIRWIRALHTGMRADVGALLFAGTPFLAIHLYQMFFLQYFCGLLLLPWVLDGQARGGRQGILQAAVVLGIIGWIHLPAALVAGYAVILIGVTRAAIEGTGRGIARDLFILAVAGAFMMPYAAPAMLGRSAVQFDVLENQFPWVRFDCLDDPVLFPDGLWETIRRFFGLGAMAFLPAIALGVSGLLGAPEIARKALPAATAAAVFFGLTLRPFIECWRWFPGLAVLQFPWRLLLPAGILAIPFVVAGVPTYAESPRRWRVAMVLIAPLLLLSAMIQSGGKPLPIADIPEIRAVGYYYPFEYLPKTCGGIEVLERAREGRELRVVAGNASAAAQFHRMAFSSWQIEIASERAELVIGTHFDPEWRMTANHAPVTIGATGSCGLIGVSLLRGTWHLELKRDSPPGRSGGWLAFAAGLLACVTLWRCCGAKAETQLQNGPPCIS